MNNATSQRIRWSDRCLVNQVVIGARDEDDDRAGMRVKGWRRGGGGRIELHDGDLCPITPPRNAIGYQQFECWSDQCLTRSRLIQTKPCPVVPGGRPTTWPRPPCVPRWLRSCHRSVHHPSRIHGMKWTLAPTPAPISTLYQSLVLVLIPRVEQLRCRVCLRLR
jgi:hypothetical protein